MRYLIIFLILVLLAIGIFAQDTVEVLMDGDKSITVHFKKLQYTLTTSVEPEGSGTISGAGIYDKGTIVEVEAVPALGYIFDYWEGVKNKWSGLGICLHDIDVVAEYEEYIDDLIAYDFTKMKIFPPKYYGVDEIAEAKVAVLYAVGKGIDVTWGYCRGVPDITADSWVDYRAGILEAAQWAQDNGVFEFRLGNEDLANVDGVTKTAAQLLIDFKSVATEVQAIFTNGNISYACRSDFIDDWIAAGKGDIDILASNVYMGGNGNYDDNWMNLITNLVNAFGVDGTYLTEFGPSWSSLDDYSTDEAVQAAAVTEMINYIKVSGITRAFFFCYANPYWFAENQFGVLKADGTYRLLWDSLLNSN